MSVNVTTTLDMVNNMCQNIASITLSAGTWIVLAQGQFTALSGYNTTVALVSVRNNTQSAVFDYPNVHSAAIVYNRLLFHKQSE